jgi:hypothetical protein
LTDAKGSAAEVPSARFAQWKAVFRAPQGKEAGVDTLNVTWVSLAYLPKNVAPVIDAVIPQSPGVRVQGFAGQPAGGGQAAPVQLRLPTPPGLPPGMGGPQQQQAQAAPRFDPPPQGFAQRGAQGAVWGARDENDDELEFAVYYRGEGEQNWKLLKDQLQQKHYSWDAGAMPDGAYYLKIVASDAPSNPPGEALTAERESDRFEVDNTPPTVANLTATPMSPAVRLEFEARDSYSAIARAEFSLNAGDWKLAFPAGRTTDAPVEIYKIELGALPPGEHTVAVRVYDQFENSASAKVTFTVEAPKKK